MVAEAHSKQQKTGTVQVNIPGFSPVTLYCDEQPPVGDDQARRRLWLSSPPVSVFCLMTHMTDILNTRRIEVTSMRLEQRVRFMTNLGTMRDLGHRTTGECEMVETHVIIDSPEPAERIHALLEEAEARLHGPLRAAQPGTPGQRGWCITAWRSIPAAADRATLCRASLNGRSRRDCGRLPQCTRFASILQSIWSTAMGTLTIRNLDDRIIETLKAQAKANHRSLEGEIRHALTQRADPPWANGGVSRPHPATSFPDRQA